MSDRTLSDMTELDRYIENSATSVKQVNPYDKLLASLTRVNLYNPPVQTCSTGWTFLGLYAGPTSIAYLFLRLSAFYPGLNFKGQSLLDWSQAYLELGASANPNVDPNYCGITNETLAQLAIRAVIDEDASLVQKLCAYSTVINSSREEGSDEWVYGRARYLYFLRLARTALHKDQAATLHDLLDSTVQATVDRILASPKPWTWYGPEYLGAAHGSIGIVTQIVLSSPERGPELRDLVSQILDTQLSSGNFRRSVAAGSDELVQFCHGAPGFVLSLQSLRPHFQNSTLTSKFDNATDLARKDVWSRGLLTKTQCLCHGLAGNALALAEQVQFEHFLAYVTSEVLEEQGWLESAGRSDEFAGLYEGESGRAWVWAVADKGLERTCIGFNDL